MNTENILSIKPGSSVYLGGLPRTRPHKHAAVVLLIGLSGPIRIEFDGEVVLECRSALLDAGVNHVLDPCGQRMASVFFDLNQRFTQWLKFQYFQNTPYAFDIIDTSLLQTNREKKLLERHWDSLFPLSSGNAGPHQFDSRILTCASSLQLPERFSDQQADFAARISLSSSRLNHLFKEATGVSFRHYKLWSQLLYFMKSLNHSRNLLDAAHSSVGQRPSRTLARASSVETPNIGALDALADHKELPSMLGAAKVGSEPFHDLRRIVNKPETYLFKPVSEMVEFVQKMEGSEHVWTDQQDYRRCR